MRDNRGEDDRAPRGGDSEDGLLESQCGPCPIGFGCFCSRGE